LVVLPELPGLLPLSGLLGVVVPALPVLPESGLLGFVVPALPALPEFGLLGVVVPAFPESISRSPLVISV